MPVKLGGVITMGISGGLVPCPEAIGILLLAISLNQLAFGLGVLVAFSIGLALVLIAIGVLLIRAQRVLTSVSTRAGRLQHWLPALSAATLVIAGIAMLTRAATSFAG
jgi:nickel/cobalt transporter (NicO) family protein